MRVLLQYAAGPWLSARLAALADDGLEVHSCDETDDRRFRALMAESEVLWHVLMPIDAEVIVGAPRLKLIQKIGVGLNTIDLEAARARGIRVCNMPETNSRAVAEMTLALMLAALRRLPAFDRATRAGAGWPLDPSRQDALGEIAGRVVGLVGFGAVPRLLAPILTAMGARVLYTATRPRLGAGAEWRELPVLLAESDIISLHLPLTPMTQGMIDTAAIRRMKPGVVLVNTARGGLVDQDALATALRSGHVRAAGLDVFAVEPVTTDNPFLKLDNVVLAPHVAWLTVETWQRSLDVAVENCRRLRDGRPLRHQVA